MSLPSWLYVSVWRFLAAHANTAQIWLARSDRFNGYSLCA